MMMMVDEMVVFQGRGGGKRRGHAHPKRFGSSGHGSTVGPTFSPFPFHFIGLVGSARRRHNICNSFKSARSGVKKQAKATVYKKRTIRQDQGSEGDVPSGWISALCVFLRFRLNYILKSSKKESTIRIMDEGKARSNTEVKQDEPERAIVIRM